MQKDQPRCAGNATVADCFLKNNWNLSAQQNIGAALDLLVQRCKQSRSRCGDVAPKNKQFGIEHVQEAYQCGNERLEGEIQHTTRARVSLGCGLKNGLGRRTEASIIEG